MKNKNILLLKTLLLSTSRTNIYKHTTDKKKKKKIVGAYIGLFFLYAMVMGYSIAMCLGYGALGMIQAAPEMCVLVISALAFMFTVFKTNGYLFNFKEYDMLMSLPLKTSDIAGCKFLYMYIKTLPWYLSVSIAMMIGYGIFARPGAWIYIAWIILSFFIPMVPMLAASFVGFIIARISSGFKKTNLIQTILTFIFVIFCFSLRYIIEAFIESGKAAQTLESLSEMTDKVGRIYLPMGWFSDAITKGSIIGFILLIVSSVAIYVVLFHFVGKSYRNINSALKSHAAAGKYKMTGQKKRSVLNAIAFKEFKRMTGSTVYITNSAMGELLALILGVATLIIGFDKIVDIVIQGAPLDHALLQPAIPFIMYFLIGMFTTTASSPSLEGKNYWIVQSLPIEKKTLYQGKILFQLYFAIPFMIFGIICLCISAKVPLINAVLYLILGVVMCCFSAAWGCVCGVKYMRLDWENDVEVIKQGTNVMVYLFPNMFVSMALTVLVVVLGMHMDHILLTLIFIVITAVLAILSYFRVLSLAAKQ